MGNTSFAWALSFLLFTTSVAEAQTTSRAHEEVPRGLEPGVAIPNIGAAALSAVRVVNEAPAPVAPSSITSAPRSRPGLLIPLYVTTALFQAYDAYSTIRAVRSGAVEANPLMKGAATKPVAFVALKAGVTAVSIASTERMWKNHRRGAVVTMLITNAVMAYVAANNTAVLRALN